MSDRTLVPELQASIAIVNGRKTTLAEKILMITSTAKKVKKTGKNRDQNYSYLSIEDAVDAVVPLMNEHGLLLTPLALHEFQFIQQDKGWLANVTFDWQLEDVATGETRSYRIPGSGWDYHDKGTFKAQTGSRKYALILIFNLPIGDNPEAQGPVRREDAKALAKATGEKKVSLMAAQGNSTAVDAMSQVVPEKKIIITRPPEHNGNYIIVTGMIAVPQLERFFDDTGSKRFKTKADLVPYWRVTSEYEKGLLQLCEKLGIEVEG